MKADAGNVCDLAQRAEDGNYRLRQFLKFQDRLSGEQLDRLVGATTDRVWAHVDCTTCANCCKELKIGLTDTDAERLAACLGSAIGEFHQRYLDKDDEAEKRGEGVRWRMRGKPCPFLAGNRCTVYEVRPEQCRKYPYLHEARFAFRTLGLIDRTFTCPIVYEVMEELKAEFGLRDRPNRRSRRR